MQKPVHFEVEYQRLIVHREEDAFGHAEPFLWIVYFKVDGESVRVNAAHQLEGAPMLHKTLGDYGNLGRKFRSGARGKIPPALGRHSMGLHPIPVDANAQAAVGSSTVDGFAGAVIALCEEGFGGNVAMAHAQFDQLVEAEITAMMATRTAAQSAPTQAEWRALRDRLAAETQAIVEGGGSSGGVGQVSNDVLIGVDLVTFNVEDFAAPSQSTSFEHRWMNHGDWEIEGRTLRSLACPAEVVFELLDLIWEGLDFRPEDQQEGAGDREPRGEGSPSPPPANLDGMRAFARRRFARLPGLQAWWDIPSQHMHRIAAVLMKDRELLASAGIVLHELGAMLDRKKKPIKHAFFDHCERLLRVFAESDTRELRRDASIALDFVPALRGRSFQQVTELLNRVEPSRRPRLDQNRHLELRPRGGDRPDCAD